TWTASKAALVVPLLPGLGVATGISPAPALTLGRGLAPPTVGVLRLQATSSSSAAGVRRKKCKPITSLTLKTDSLLSPGGPDRMDRASFFCSRGGGLARGRPGVEAVEPAGIGGQGRG